MAKRSKAIRALEYFPCQAPPAALFKSRINDLRGIAHLGEANHSSEILELVKIGLTAYFEAFCKDQFGSMICLAPSLIKNLAAAGHDTSLDASWMVDNPQEFEHQIGFYIAEKYDFGTPSKINSHFKALIRITPFSSKARVAYDAIIHDRNLLAHHGGTFTTLYVRNAKSPDRSAAKAFQDGIVLSAAQINDDLDLVERIAYALTVNTHKALTAHIYDGDMRVGAEKKKALEFISWWEEG